MRTCFFEDHAVAAFEPLVSTRPIFDLYCGFQTLAAKQAHYFASGLTGRLVRPDLEELVRQQNPHEPVNDLRWLRRGPVVLVNGRWLPPDTAPPVLDSPVVAWADDEIAWVLLTTDGLASLNLHDWDENFAHWRRSLPARLAGGRMLRQPWDLLASSAHEIARDLRTRGEQPYVRPMDFSLVGPAGRLRIDPTARVDPLVVADTTNGPVIIEREAVVTAFTRLEGPCYIGPAAIIQSASIHAGTTIGRASVVGGEVAESILHGFVDKPFNGYLGRSYVGEWVEIGAGSQTAHSLTTDHRRTAAGLSSFLDCRDRRGCLIGDQARIGSGTILPAGATIGVFASLRTTAAMAPSYLPAFATFHHGRVEYENHGEKELVRADERMRRRNVEPTSALREVYCRLLDDVRYPRYDIRTSRRDSA
jgi:carbonic anhydrase/acetyltransferase-like protein (isoleucine patch superfamily)